MDEIVSEAQWLSCDHPLDLSFFVRGRMDPTRFRWLAVEWGGRMRHEFEPEDLPWYDAFAAWVAGIGPHPSTVCEKPQFYPLDYPFERTHWARRCADAIRDGDSLRAAAYASLSASDSYPALDSQNFAHTHVGRSAAKRAAVDARREAWHVAKESHRRHVWSEFCDQFRDVAGNPFHPVNLLPEWRTTTVTDMAQAIDSEKAFDRMPALADALLETGCVDDHIIGHCRGTVPHVRGCWLIAELLVGSSAYVDASAAVGIAATHK